MAKTKKAKIVPVVNDALDSLLPKIESILPIKPTLEDSIEYAKTMLENIAQGNNVGHMLPVQASSLDVAGLSYNKGIMEAYEGKTPYVYKASSTLTQTLPVPHVQVDWADDFAPEPPCTPNPDSIPVPEGVPGIVHPASVAITYFKMIRDTKEDVMTPSQWDTFFPSSAQLKLASDIKALLGDSCTCGLCAKQMAYALWIGVYTPEWPDKTQMSNAMIAPIKFPDAEVIGIVPSLNPKHGIYPGTKPKTRRAPWSLDKLPRVQRGTLVETQKATGILALSEKHPEDANACHMEVWGPGVVLAVLPQFITAEIGFPAFARPCPVTPRHGFVESREVWTLHECYDLLTEARTVDPKAEVLLMPKLTGLFSGVVTPNGVTWGMFNDGVTSGKGSEHIPAQAPFDPYCWNSTTKRMLTFHDYSLSALGMSQQSTEEPPVAYIELVEDRSRSRAVQYRPGPQVPPGVQDYVPVKLTVSRVIDLDQWTRKHEGEGATTGEVTSDQLVTWEKEIAEWKTEPGLVIDGEGYAMSSHWAVHAIANKIPFITSHMPVEGEVIELPQGAKECTLTDDDLSRLNGYISRFAAMPLIPWRIDEFSQQSRDVGEQLLSEIAVTAIGTVHAQTTWDNASHLLVLRAFAVVNLARLLGTVCLGELRHWYSCGPGRKAAGLYECPVDFKAAFGFDIRTDRPSRDRVFYRSAYYHYDDLAKMMPNIFAGFDHDAWTRNEGGSSYGGQKWAIATSQARDLFDAIDNFRLGPDSDTWAAVIMTANSAINAAHNCGYLLDKIVDKDVFGFASTILPMFFANATCGAVTMFSTEYLDAMRGRHTL